MGQAIGAIAVKPTGTQEYPASLLAQGTQIGNGEEVLLACPEIPQPAATESGVELKKLADILVTLADGATFELHQVDVYGIESAEVRLEGETVYLQYVAKSGESVSTLESEKAIAQQRAEEAAAAEAAAAAAAEEAAAAEPETAAPDEYYEYDYSYDNGYDDSWGYDDSSYYVDDSAVGGGDEEQCIPDIVLRY